MLFAVLVAVLSVLLGAALSFAPGNSRGLLGYMRTFATLAAVAVVVTHLLPEALQELGPFAILLFLVGWFAPGLAHFIGQRSTAGRPAHAVLEAGYWGLVVHHVADGIGLGTYSRLPAAQGSHVDVIVALAAHTVPLIAVVSIAYRTTFGARSAVVRSLGLALASVFGIGLSSLVAGRTIASFAPVIAAVAAGLLLHVVTHDLKEDPPVSRVARLIDLGVAGLGVAVSLFGIERSAAPATSEFARRLELLGSREAVVILVGLAVGALLFRVLNPRSKLAHAALPAGALGPESALLGVALFGFVGTTLRLIVTAATAQALAAAPAAEVDDLRKGPWRERAAEALARSGPWLALGLLVGALLGSIPPSALVQRAAGTLPELLLIALVANITPVAAPAALLIAAGLGGAGLSNGAVLLFGTLAPLVAAREFKLQKRLFASLLCLVVALSFNRLGLTLAPLAGAAFGGTLPTLALAALLLFGVWQRGARIWLSSIVKTPAHEHEHAHDVHGPHAH